MTLTEDQIAKFKAHFADKDLKCPLCENRREWDLAIVTPPIIGKEGLVGQEKLLLPLLIVVCAHCYHAMTFAWQPIERGGL